MYRLSDSDSVDSDKGVRYKTDSIRNKSKSSETDSPSSRYRSERERRRSRSRSPHHHKRKKAKKQKRKHSSEDEYEERSSSRNNDKRSSHECLSKHKWSREFHNELEKKMSDRQYAEETLKKVESRAFFGPALPPKIVDTSKTQESSVTILPTQSLTELPLEKDKSKEQHQLIGPSLPLDLKKSESAPVMGPALPPHLLKKVVSSDPSCSNEAAQINLEENLSDENSNKSENSAFGPLLPPKSEEKPYNSVLPNTTEPEDKIIGPWLPPELRQKICDDSYGSLSPPTDESADATVGPVLPPYLKQKLLEESSTSETDILEMASKDEVYGPIPAGENYSRAHIELEERALKLKMDQLEPLQDKQPNREEWMLTLPAAKAANFGLGPRQFKTKAGPDLSDRSSWTDTPEDKARKKEDKEEPKDLQREAVQEGIRKRDEEQEAIAKKNKKHKKSLLEMHQKKLKKEKNVTGPTERRPFSRDIDLQVNRFDEAQKKAILKKAQLLDNRFSSGESKFL